jgi:membrane protein DedA with SNARE-associated domain
VLTGVGSPIPEDLLLLTAGYLVFNEVFGWPAALASCLAGVVVSDLILYSAGRHLAWRSTAGTGRRLLSPERLARATGWFDRVGDHIVLVARLVPGTRAMIFLTAGACGRPVGRFLRYDVLGACLWVPAMLVTGHAAGSRLGDIETVVAWIGRSAVWMLLAICVLLIVRLTWGREGSKL